jgi:hypothetical protein
MTAQRVSQILPLSYPQVHTTAQVTPIDTVSPSLTTHLPFRNPQANRKAECGESRPLRLEGGKDCKVLPILTPPQEYKPQ